MSKKFYIPLVICLLGLTVLNYFKPKEVDWTIDLRNSQSKPFGNYVFYHSLVDLFGEKPSVNRKPILDLLKKQQEKSLLILISEKCHVDSTEWNQLNDWVAEGNELFLSSLQFPEFIGKDLKITPVSNHFNVAFDTLDYQFEKEGSLSGRLKNLGLITFWELGDSTDTEIVSTVKNKEEEFVQSVYMNIGKGRIILDANPLAYTNVNVLYNDGEEYLEHMMSLFRSEHVIWDEYLSNQLNKDRSIFSVLLAYEPLQNAFLWFVFGVFMYLLIGGKRMQRAIPIVNPLVNTTQSFVESIGYLSYLKKDHKSLLKNKWHNFNEYLFENYKSNLLNKTEDEIYILERKMGLKNEELVKLVNGYFTLIRSQEVYEGRLISFVKRINQIKKNKIK